MSKDFSLSELLETEDSTNSTDFALEDFESNDFALEDFVEETEIPVDNLQIDPSIQAPEISADPASIADPTSLPSDPTAIAAQQNPFKPGITATDLKYLGGEAKAVPGELAKGGVRFVENFLLGGSARLERMVGDLISAFPQTVQDSIIGDWVADDMVLGPTMETINNIGETLTKHGSETSKYWAEAANTGWEAVKKNNETPVAGFIGQTSEAAYSSALLLGIAYLSGGSSLAAEASALPLSSSATMLSAQTKAAIASMSAMSASSAWEETKDLGGTNLEAMTQFAIDYSLEYFGETTAFGEVFAGHDVGVAKLTLNSMLEEGGVGFGQDFRSTFNVSR